MPPDKLAREVGPDVAGLGNYQYTKHRPRRVLPPQHQNKPEHDPEVHERRQRRPRATSTPFELRVRECHTIDITSTPAAAVPVMVNAVSG